MFRPQYYIIFSSYVPTSSRASRSLSALSIPVFSFVWFLKAACQYFKLHIRSLKSLNFNRPLPELCLDTQECKEIILFHYSE